MNNSRCSRDPSHGAHGGTCGHYLAEEVAFLAEQDGIVREPTRIGFPPAFRRHAATRLGVTTGALDRALYRH